MDSKEVLSEREAELIRQIQEINKTLRAVLEGNIGTGKSSFLIICEITKIVRSIQEGVKIWEEIGILADFYEDPEKYAFLLQSITFATRLASLGHIFRSMNAENAENPRITITERSVWADRYCFAENLAKDGVMSAKELKIYQIWHRILINGHLNITVPDVIIYLRASPETSKRRQEIRARKSENVIPIEYFQQLHDRHEEWLLGDDKWDIGAIGIPNYDIRNKNSEGNDSDNNVKTKYMKNAPVYVIDVDKDYENVAEYRIFILEHLLEILKKYGKTKSERIGFDKKLEDLTKFPDESEIIEFVKQLNMMFPHKK